MGDIEQVAGMQQELEEEVNILGAGAPAPSSYLATGYPQPLKRYRIVFESNKTSIEEPYYWILNHIKQDMAFSQVVKITDTLTASENSSIFGVQVQRLNLQQDKAAQYMVDVEAALKALRITKERIEVHLGLDGSDTRQG